MMLCNQTTKTTTLYQKIEKWLTAESHLKNRAFISDIMSPACVSYLISRLTIRTSSERAASELLTSRAALEWKWKKRQQQQSHVIKITCLKIVGVVL